MWIVVSLKGEVMETGVNLTGYDFVIIGLSILFIVRGLWLGLLKQVTGLLALYLGYYIASQYHDRLFPFLKDLSNNPNVVFVASVAILFVVTFLIAMLVGKGLSHVIEIAITKWFDRFLGGIMGVCKAAIVIVLLHMVLSSILPPENGMLRDCRTCDGVNTATDYARAVIKDEEVRNSLKQQTPAISAEDVMNFFEGSGPQGDDVYTEQPSALVE